MTPTPRPHLADLPPYTPGRPAPQGAFKLSANENPYPPLPGVLAATTATLDALNRYPDMGATALYDALAARFGVATDRLALGTGSVSLIYQLLAAFCEPGDEVVYAWRSFEAYPIAVTVAGARSVQVPLTADARHDLPAMAAAVTDRTKVLLVCTPNNPTGPALTHTELAGFLGTVPAHVLVVVDEAYLEFVRMADPVDGLALARDFPHVVLTRTFSKAYGLAALRVGYAISTPEIAGALRAVALPFGVSTAGQAAAVASLAAEAELLARVDALVAERDRVLAGVRAAGWSVPEAQGNFVWLPTVRVSELAAAAAELGLVVRPLGDGVRASIGEPEAGDLLIKLAESFRP
ncbi:histidinol-phosphate transaminase [Nocardioides sp.]|uniref:histidinol-phosphate transaminase n=1 Tax=Nocardioides sp. TaxID=35761 RepID=UPI0039E54556